MIGAPPSGGGIARTHPPNTALKLPNRPAAPQLSNPFVVPTPRSTLNIISDMQSICRRQQQEGGGGEEVQLAENRGGGRGGGEPTANGSGGRDRGGEESAASGRRSSLLITTTTDYFHSDLAEPASFHHHDHHDGEETVEKAIRQSVDSLSLSHFLEDVRQVAQSSRASQLQPSSRAGDEEAFRDVEEEEEDQRWKNNQKEEQGDDNCQVINQKNESKVLQQTVADADLFPHQTISPDTSLQRTPTSVAPPAPPNIPLSPLPPPLSHATPLSYPIHSTATTSSHTPINSPSPVAALTPSEPFHRLVSQSLMDPSTYAPSIDPPPPPRKQFRRRRRVIMQ
eukprot:GHVS01064351.1.p1 GENE.GHVS01064351.1~~GHVS01064351.1.p1  ORF type:complete len:339 (+),score=87.85 GHVS01064351.1:670-1686(+)